MLIASSWSPKITEITTEMNLPKNKTISFELEDKTKINVQIISISKKTKTQDDSYVIYIIVIVGAIILITLIFAFCGSYGAVQRDRVSFIKRKDKIEKKTKGNMIENIFEILKVRIVCGIVRWDIDSWLQAGSGTEIAIVAKLRTLCTFEDLEAKKKAAAEESRSTQTLRNSSDQKNLVLLTLVSIEDVPKLAQSQLHLRSLVFMR